MQVRGWWESALERRREAETGVTSYTAGRSTEEGISEWTFHLENLLRMPEREMRDGDYEGEVRGHGRARSKEERSWEKGYIQ